MCPKWAVYVNYLVKYFFVRALYAVIERNMKAQYPIPPASGGATGSLRWGLWPRNSSATAALTLRRCLCITSVTLWRHPLMYVAIRQRVWLTGSPVPPPPLPHSSVMLPPVLRFHYPFHPSWYSPPIRLEHLQCHPLQ